MPNEARGITTLLKQSLLQGVLVGRNPRYSPHMPRRGAPQAPHGPVSEDTTLNEPPETAKVERSYSTRGLSQSLQTTSDALEVSILSNFAPHS